MAFHAAYASTERPRLCASLRSYDCTWHTRHRKAFLRGDQRGQGIASQAAHRPYQELSDSSR